MHNKFNLKNSIFLFGSNFLVGFEIKLKIVANSNDEMKLYTKPLTSRACISLGVVNFKSHPLTCGVMWNERSKAGLYKNKHPGRQRYTDTAEVNNYYIYSSTVHKYCTLLFLLYLFLSHYSYLTSSVIGVNI